MFEHLTNPVQLESAWRRLTSFLDSHAEWFCTLDEGNTLALRRHELEIRMDGDRLILWCWTEKGTRSRRIKSVNWNGEKVTLHASRRMGAKQPLIELVPRASAIAIAATVRASRQLRCRQLAQLACAVQPGAKIERVSLSPGIRRGQPGRYARILLRKKHQRIAITASVASSHPGNVDAFLSAALLWFTRATERAGPPFIEQLWLVVEKQIAKPLVLRIALLRESFREAISVYEIDNDWSKLNRVTCPTRDELWKKRLARFPPVFEPAVSELAKRIVAEGPEAIDVVQARHGQTLRYFGLPFARIRRVMDTERVWFGLDGSSKHLLDNKTRGDWFSLLRDLKEHRSAQATDHRHALYRNGAEAWLESLLRRDITRLDPGLIIAPLHTQFRTAKGGLSGARPIDLLALRQDGRLVVIELKVSEDREHILQGADYWQRVEAHRRQGHISQAKLFGERTIRAEAPLVYLVAPTLRVHPAFQTLARAMAPDIEIYAFDINEDWRRGVRVMRRGRVP